MCKARTHHLPPVRALSLAAWMLQYLLYEMGCMCQGKSYVWPYELQMTVPMCFVPRHLPLPVLDRLKTCGNNAACPALCHS